ncbi:MAG: hypothetical protein CMJ19_18765 [Phycisphaeraceae bacterium]|nr:hypothetical protein [Phycisphaeraceae bacterium]|tara:strand:- start:46 stop:543 length:498 start_codon:yes stop_codon:yes gene_type:complete
MSQLSRPLICLAVLALLLPACRSTQTTPPAGVQKIVIKLQSLTTDKRYSYFELEPNGQLSFGGGFDAITKNAKPVMTLNTQQLKSIESFINQSNLLTANLSGKQDRKNSKDVHHELVLKLGNQSRTLQVNDNQIPAVGQLHDMIFDFYAKARYNLPGIGTPDANQ